jgi:hypothetical protein
MCLLVTSSQRRMCATPSPAGFSAFRSMSVTDSGEAQNAVAARYAALMGHARVLGVREHVGVRRVHAALVLARVVQIVTGRNRPDTALVDPTMHPAPVVLAVGRLGTLSTDDALPWPAGIGRTRDRSAPFAARWPSAPGARRGAPGACRPAAPQRPSWTRGKENPTRRSRESGRLHGAVAKDHAKPGQRGGG